MFEMYDSKEAIELIREHYIPLLTLFVDKKISVTQFEEQFTRLFKEDNTSSKISTFHVLEAIFGDLKACYPNPDPAEWPAEIGEQELYKNCQDNLQKLRQIVDRKEK